MLKWLQRRACFSFGHISSILFGSCDHLENGTKEWILILRRSNPILPNTKRPFWCMWRMNTVPNIDVCRSTSTKVFWAAISSPLQWLHDSVNHPLIHTICAAMMKNTQCLTMWLRLQQDEAIAQHQYRPPPGSIWICHLKHQETGGKWTSISMITTPTQWRLPVHFGYWT